MTNIERMDRYTRRAYGRSRVAAPGHVRRSDTDRMLGGVAGGIAEYLGVDPLFVRLGFVVTTISGGMGLIAYLILWAILPDGESPEDIVARRLEDEEITAAEYREILSDLTGGKRSRRR
jgi:phage shock protein PspC (stress-responsive transcriptional regulator)